MKFFSKLIVLAGAVLGLGAAAANAEPIVASVSIAGTPVVTTATNPSGPGYIYTSLGLTSASILNNNVVPNSGGVTAANSTVLPYFANGTPITFNTLATPATGVSGTVPGSTATSGGSQIFSATGTGGATLAFYITSYTVTLNTAANSAGTTGNLLISGNGYYMETATGRTFTNTAATYSLSLSGNGTFSFSANAVTNVAATPEPSSLVLLGTGLIGAAGVVFRRRSLVA